MNVAKSDLQAEKHQDQCCRKFEKISEVAKKGEYSVFVACLLCVCVCRSSQYWACGGWEGWVGIEGWCGCPCNIQSWYYTALLKGANYRSVPKVHYSNTPWQGRNNIVLGCQKYQTYIHQITQALHIWPPSWELFAFNRDPGVQDTADSLLQETHGGTGGAGTEACKGNSQHWLAFTSSLSTPGYIHVYLGV